MDDAQAVTVEADALEYRVARVRKFAELLDDSVRLPVLDYRIGIDAIAGLLPVIGDSFGLICSLLIVVEAARLGVSKTTLVAMVANVVLDAVGGSLPVVGDLFDAMWKANLKNVRLLERDLLG